MVYLIFSNRIFLYMQIPMLYYSQYLIFPNYHILFCISSIASNSRRGYSDASMNTNELIWNAQLSHSFLRGKALTLSLQFYDILHQQSTFSRAITAMQRSDTEYNAITSYAMLHVIYRLNVFGGKAGREGMRGGPGGPGGREGRGFGGRGGGFGGGRGGGFGGGRPGRF